MKFMLQYTIDPPMYKAAVARFLQTGGLPPEGAKLLGRWNAGGQGWLLAESDSAKAIYEWTAQWADLIRFPVVTPVSEDEETAAVLQKLNT